MNGVLAVAGTHMTQKGTNIFDLCEFDYHELWPLLELSTLHLETKVLKNT